MRAPRPKVLQIIARLNIGGPAIQVITLARRLEEEGYDCLILRGVEAPDEGSMDDLAARAGLQPRRIRSLKRAVGPQDLPAILSVLRILLHERPAIVHTHTAKAGTVGRLAVLLLPKSRRPRLVHTFHGHSLTGYFSGFANQFFVRVERLLARKTDAIIAVSDEVKDDLTALGVHGPHEMVVIPLGLELAEFADDTWRNAHREQIRRELGVGIDAPLVTLVTRLAPIKRVDRFLAIAERIATASPDVRFAVVGDGELRDQLQTSAAAQRLRQHLVWCGFRRDMPAICHASDVIALTSDNEGTPTSLIEAQAAGVPVVATRVGGVPSVVTANSARVVAPEDEAGFAAGVLDFVHNADAARTAGEAGRKYVLGVFAIDRMVQRVNELYRDLLERRPVSV